MLKDKFVLVALGVFSLFFGVTFAFSINVARNNKIRESRAIYTRVDGTIVDFEKVMRLKTMNGGKSIITSYSYSVVVDVSGLSFTSNSSSIYYKAEELGKGNSVTVVIKDIDGKKVLYGIE